MGVDDSLANLERHCALCPFRRLQGYHVQDRSVPVVEL
jgi:hypothetical protein